jgi:hypothetical protein
MVFALSAGWAYSIGLIATFGGIGLVVNALLAYIGIQIAAEREENRRLDREQVTG